MKTTLSKLYNSSPKKMVDYVIKKLGYYQPNYSSINTIDESKVKRLSDKLRKNFSIYKTTNLQSVTVEEFTTYVQSQIGMINYQIEEYSADELEQQRDLSIKFCWGHNHDFGNFKLKGRMGDRHINLLVDFTSLFPISLENLKNKNVFDIGCWTGGTTLLLSTLANNVFAIEEVKKYAEMTSYLVKSFGMNDRVVVKPLSIYDCNSEEFYDRFDIVHFPGVIYHLSDPLLALRILFNSLKVEGIILVESAGINREEALCTFEGSLIYHSGNKERLNRGGWNWFKPSPSALYRMMKEAGFDEIQTHWYQGRVYGYGKKLAQVSICKAGLSASIR